MKKIYKNYLTEISKKSKNVYNTQYASLVNINNPLNILPSSEQTISSPLHHTRQKTMMISVVMRIIGEEEVMLIMVRHTG